MGGRGRSSGLTTRQITIEDTQRRHDIADIIQESEERRKLLRSRSGAGSGGVTSPSLYRKCACCGNYTIPINSEYETCPICDWVDDKYQNNNPNSLDGINPMTLSQMRIIYQNKIADN